jgi:hypothetical protein
MKSKLDELIEKLALDAPTIEEIWKITDKLPSLIELLREERDD